MRAGHFIVIYSFHIAMNSEPTCATWATHSHDATPRMGNIVDYESYKSQTNVLHVMEGNDIGAATSITTILETRN